MVAALHIFNFIIFFPDSQIQIMSPKKSKSIIFSPDFGQAKLKVLLIFVPIFIWFIIDLVECHRCI